MSVVTVVDYGVGNLFSVSRALERCGAEVLLTDTAAGIEAAERLVLPGVGAFADGMQGLRERGLVAPLQAYARSGRPLLGICLGMQMLMEYSQEFGNHEGLGIIAGSVVNVPALTPSGRLHKIPHIGWSELRVPAGREGWQGTVLEALGPGSSAYFVHSYMSVPVDPACRLADCDYDGVTVSAAIARDAVTGCQFHPEKSGKVGLAVMRRFLQG